MCTIGTAQAAQDYLELPLHVNKVPALLLSARADRRTATLMAEMHVLEVIERRLLWKLPLCILLWYVYPVLLEIFQNLFLVVTVRAFKMVGTTAHCKPLHTVPV